MPLNKEQVKKSQSLLGNNTVEMLFQADQDALWLLENLGMGCKNRHIQEAFAPFEAEGLAVVHDNRIYVMSDLVAKCLQTVPGVKGFFVPLNSFFIGGSAPYVYDDESGQGGIIPRPEHVADIAKIAEKSGPVAGMGRGVKIKDEAEQIQLMAKHCSKPIFFPVATAEGLARAKETCKDRSNIFILFCLTRPPLEVNENLSEYFVQVVRAGIPVALSSMPMAGISAPYCYNGVLSVTHAEAIFGICAAQLLNRGITCVHAGFPTIADPRIEFNPNYGLISHNLLNILMAHLNLMLDLPSFQSAGTTHEEHPTERAYQDAKTGQALCLKYGVHMIRHPFAFLRYLIDFSFEKLETTIQNFEAVKPEDAPDVEMPTYDKRVRDSFQNIGLGMYLDDPLTTANIGKVFVE